MSKIKKNPIFCSFNLLDVENQILFTEFKNLSSLSRYETSKWTAMVFRKCRNIYASIGGGEIHIKFTQNKPSNYISASPIHLIAMKIGTIYFG